MRRISWIALSVLVHLESKYSSNTKLIPRECSQEMNRRTEISFFLSGSTSYSHVLPC